MTTERLSMSLKDQGLPQKSNGLSAVFMEEFANKEGEDLQPIIVQKTVRLSVNAPQQFSRVLPSTSWSQSVL